MSMPREELKLSTAYQPPGDDLQRRLADLWSQKLGVAPIGLHDDFFELGGDSLLAADLQLAIDRMLGVEIPTWTLFLTPTVAELAATVVEALAGAQPDQPATDHVAGMHW
ncbi:phosphopantetheine-binding protein [Micromonospora zhanjiangensis]|uniref:Phosphopantetheine-binding protein n=1 Tax=Micromonospora zhanjiangensis TaxID=1522057 RepID=A0ABV8KR71_9ACTN